VDHVGPGVTNVAAKRSGFGGKAPPIKDPHGDFLANELLNAFLPFEEAHDRAPETIPLEIGK
jgi:hypothetical protein